MKSSFSSQGCDMGLSTNTRDVSMMCKSLLGCISITKYKRTGSDPQVQGQMTLPVLRPCCLRLVLSRGDDTPSRQQEICLRTSQTNRAREQANNEAMSAVCDLMLGSLPVSLFSNTLNKQYTAQDLTPKPESWGLLVQDFAFCICGGEYS